MTLGHILGDICKTVSSFVKLKMNTSLLYGALVFQCNTSECICKSDVGKPEISVSFKQIVTVFYHKILIRGVCIHVLEILFVTIVHMQLVVPVTSEPDKIMN